MFKQINLKTARIKFIALFSFLFLFYQGDSFSQATANSYKANTDFKDFRHKREEISGIQIMRLQKEGALIVILHTSQLKINALKSIGKANLAKQASADQEKENKTIVRAFLKEFRFCPVYFTSSNTNDSLLKKKLTAIFLDTNLIVNASIQLKENFYLIAEKDVIYNSSIGYPDSEEEAAKQIENGTAVKQAALVVKDKFLHQLKRPFPFYVAGYSTENYNHYAALLDYNFRDFYGKERINRVKDEFSIAKKKLKAEKKAAKADRKSGIAAAKKETTQKSVIRKIKFDAHTKKKDRIATAEKNYALEYSLIKAKLADEKKANKIRLGKQK